MGVTASRRPAVILNPVNIRSCFQERILITPSSGTAGRAGSRGGLDLFDRITAAYLLLPLVAFVVGWLTPVAAVALLACTLVGARSLAAPLPAPDATRRIARLGVLAACVVAVLWTVLSGIDHLVFTNFDWHVRDAVLHDLVLSSWPVGYGPTDGTITLLRAPLAYFLPAALVGKALGLPVAHAAIAAWTALGVALFLVQLISLVPQRALNVGLMLLLAVFFSGLDIIGMWLNWGIRYYGSGSFTTHLEWWAAEWQYSSMTTQLFWVPNHALGAWLVMGLLARNVGRTQLAPLLPILFAAIMLWSPLSALGALPYVAWYAGAEMWRERSLALLRPIVWLPAALVAVVVAAYLALDLGKIPKGVVDPTSVDGLNALLRILQFVLLEAGILAIVILLLRRSAPVVVAIIILSVLPLAHLGPGNDLVMRASIPSLIVLLIGAGRALAEPDPGRPVALRFVLAAILAIGAMTPLHEFARALKLDRWPIDTRATLIAANCGHFPPHYVARLHAGEHGMFLGTPSNLQPDPSEPLACFNPALWLMSREPIW